MRLPVNRILALGILGFLAACGHADGTDTRVSAVPPLHTNGPEADYPVVLGAPITIDGVTYTPQDKLNFDAVGYAVIASAESGEGINAASRTMPLPSYAEVTSLETGRTILVRVTRRGPMMGAAIIDLSPAAAAQLGMTTQRTAIRIRRVNPPEAERALLRADQKAPMRMDTPPGLVNVLRRKLDPSLPPIAAPGMPFVTSAAPASPPTAVVAASAAPEPAKAPPITPAKALAAKLAQQKPAQATARPAVAAPHQEAKGSFIVQVGAYGAAGRAEQVAARVGGKATTSGKLVRVRVGPFPSRGEAEAALAKARAAGYSDARIQRVD